jgi:putative transposase
MRYEFIKEHQDLYSIGLMCRLLKVSSSGYYNWRQRVVSKREMANRKLFEHIHRVFHENRQVYGPIRVWKALKKEGIGCGRDRVARLMKVHNLRCKKQKRYIATTKSDPSKKPAPNLLDQNFEAEAPNQKWSSDITYIRTGEGWLFLVLVVDLFSRKIVGWAMDATMTADLVCRAYQMACQQRRPEAQLLHHSDRGSQYTSHDFQQLLADSKAIPSMSRKGNCFDNAASESLFGTLKSELVPEDGYPDRLTGQTDIFRYIEGFYNRKRLHSSLDYCSPDEFEANYWKNQSTTLASNSLH